MHRGGRSLDDVKAWDATADGADILAEGIGPRATKTLGSAARMGHTAPERVRTVLDERAADEAPQFAARLRTLTGADMRDASSVAQESRAAVQPRVRKLYAKATAQPDVDSPEVGSVLADLQDMGEVGILKRARKTAVGRNSLAPDQTPTTTISVANLQRTRRTRAPVTSACRGALVPRPHSVRARLRLGQGRGVPPRSGRLRHEAVSHRRADGAGGRDGAARRSGAGRGVGPASAGRAGRGPRTLRCSPHNRSWAPAD